MKKKGLSFEEKRSRMLGIFTDGVREAGLVGFFANLSRKLSIISRRWKIFQAKWASVIRGDAGD
jgi:hypothetical protein